MKMLVVIEDKKCRADEGLCQREPIATPLGIHPNRVCSSRNSLCQGDHAILTDEDPPVVAKEMNRLIPRAGIPDRLRLRRVAYARSFILTQDLVELALKLTEALVPPWFKLTTPLNPAWRKESIPIDRKWHF